MAIFQHYRLMTFEKILNFTLKSKGIYPQQGPEIF
jgi:hypothetical protein